MKSFASEVYQAVKVGKLLQPFNAAMAKKDLKCLRNGVLSNFILSRAGQAGKFRNPDFTGKCAAGMPPCPYFPVTSDSSQASSASLIMAGGVLIRANLEKRKDNDEGLKEPPTRFGPMKGWCLHVVPPCPRGR